MLDRAEPVGDPVLATVADQHEAPFGECRAAVGALGRAFRTDGGVGLARLEVRALDSPRDYVLEAAEDGAPAAPVLDEPVAVPGPDLVSAPRAARMLASR
jgi:hypothetical protein